MKYTVQKLILLAGLLVGVSYGEQHALLVGASQYPNLEKSAWLEGPPKDVEMVYDVLTGPRFKVPGNNVVTLAGWPDDVEKRPTRENIEKGFRDLANKVKPGDQVMILMSGHGSQVPANADPADLEPDGLDEVFLPADTAKWDEVSGEVKGIIRDDDIKVWVDQIRARGAFVWIIFDSCHSGTMTRSMTSQNRVARQIDPAWLSPPAALASVSGVSTRGVPAANEPEWGEDQSYVTGGLVAMYAAQSLEPTFELPLPEPTSPRRGLFTFTIVQILQNAESPISYRDLADLVNVIYRSNGLFQPTPLIEGNGLDHQLLGSEQISDPDMIHLTGQFHTLFGMQVQAGTLTGLRSGSVLEIFPPAGTSSSDKSLGAMKVTKCDATFSYLQPQKWETLPAASLAEVGLGCRAKVVFENYGNEKLKVGLESVADGKTSPVNLTSPPKEWAGAVKALSEKGAGTYELSLPEDADWLIRREDGQFSLVPATGWSARSGSGNAPAIFYPKSNDKLRTAVEQIARTRQLMRIAGNSGHSTDVQMKVELIRFKDGKEEVMGFGKQGLSLRPGDEVAFRIHNPGITTIDVTLLFIDSGMGITSLFPESGTVDDNRIPPRQTITTPHIEVTADTAGPERVVALGVRASRDRVDFSSLEQASLATVRGAPALDSPLGRLLKTTMYGEGETRGLKRSTDSAYAGQVIAWETKAD